jgi:hypothetical protein
MEQPDLSSMTDDQVAEWFATNDTSGLTGTGRPVQGQFVQRASAAPCPAASLGIAAAIRWAGVSRLPATGRAG